MSLKDRIKKIQIPLNFWTVGGTSLILVLICYAILSPNLRFYLDDWPQLYSIKMFGLFGFKQYNLYDGRPFGYWPGYLFYLLFGDNALLWHINIYLLRWLTAMFFWATFIQVWPRHKLEISWATILFAVYPLFTQISMSVGFTPHFVCYLLFFVSTFFMVLALRKRKYFWLFMVLAVAFDIVNLFTYEYFVGIEFLRPFLIWFVLREEKPRKVGFGKILTFWLPYLATSLAFIVYRIFLIQLPGGGRNSPIMLQNLIHTPIATIVTLTQDVLRDTTYVLLETWHTAFNPDSFNLASPSLNLSWVVVFLAADVFLVYTIFTRKRAAADEKVDKVFIWQAFLVGFLGILLGCAPGWTINATVSNDSGLHNDRFAMAAMFAGALFIVVFIFWLIEKHYWRKVVIVALLVGFAAGQNFRVANDYRWSSIYQTRFAYELLWRAPYLESPTVLFADNEMFGKMGVYPTAFMLNLLYPNVPNFPYMDYWFFTLNHYFPNDASQLPNGIEVNASHWYSIFDTNSRNGLVIAWHPENNQCIWILTENDRDDPTITDLTKSALRVTNLSRISTTHTPVIPDTNLFGKENTNQWCYYYEKGDLDRQLGNWSEAVTLYETATAKGFSTNFGEELMPFIEAYAHMGDGEKALALTKDAGIKNENIYPYICDNWIRIAGDLKDNASVQGAFQTIIPYYRCDVTGK